VSLSYTVSETFSVK